MVRPGHPLHGLDLPVWGRLRVRGVAMVVLVLPDGSRKRIPAAWAPEGGSEVTSGPAAAVVAAAGDLLRLLRVISGNAPPPGSARSKLHGSHQARRTTGSLHNSVCWRTRLRRHHAAGRPEPSPIAQAAAAIVTRLIIQAAQPGSTDRPATQSRRGKGAAGGERR